MVSLQSGINGTKTNAPAIIIYKSSILFKTSIIKMNSIKKSGKNKVEPFLFCIGLNKTDIKPSKTLIKKLG